MNKEHLPVAEEFMTTPVHSVTTQMPLADVVAFLLKHGISNAPVVELDEQHRPILVGFLSERDCLDFLANEMFFGSPAQPQTAGSIMKRHPVCVSPATDVFTLSSVFVSHGHRHLPVVKDHVLIGIVSRRDILKALDRYYREAIRENEERRSPRDLHEIIHHRFLVSSA